MGSKTRLLILFSFLSPLKDYFVYLEADLPFRLESNSPLFPLFLYVYPYPVKSTADLILDVIAARDNGFFIRDKSRYWHYSSILLHVPIIFFIVFILLYLCFLRYSKTKNTGNMKIKIGAAEVIIGPR